MQLEIEEQALKGEKDAVSANRLQELQAELSDIKEEQSTLQNKVGKEKNRFKE